MSLSTFFNPRSVAVVGVYGEGFDEMKVKIKEKDIKKIK